MKADINGARIHYRREGAGFPILMFHAGIADSRMWQPQADEFAQQFDVIRPDMRGYGDFERFVPNARMERFSTARLALNVRNPIPS